MKMYMVTEKFRESFLKSLGPDREEAGSAAFIELLESSAVPGIYLPVDWCTHPKYGDTTRCAEMICPNYINKHEDNDLYNDGEPVPEDDELEEELDDEELDDGEPMITQPYQPADFRGNY